MQRRRTMVGRSLQLAALGEVYREVADGGRFVLVTGPAGSGRTTLLDAVADGWRADGATVLRVHGHGASNPVAGFTAVLHALREQYEQLADPLLGRPLSMIAALCAGSESSPVLAQQTSVAFEVVSRRAPVVVVVADDVDVAPGLTTALAAAVRDGCLVVAAAPTAAGRPGALADRIVDLSPLDADDIRELLHRRYGAPIDDGVVPALTAALGPLDGNTATVVDVAADLVRSGRLGVVSGHLCLLDPHLPIALPAEHRLVVAVRDRGAAAVRIATTAAITRLSLDDLPLFADATLGRPGSYGRLVDELTEAGVLVPGPQRDLRLSCPALSARLVLDAGPVAVARLHRVYAAAMFRRAGGAVDRAALADHVAHAGLAVPTDRRTAVDLATTAVGATDREPVRAADWLRAALWHAGGGEAADDILSRLVRVLVRTGQFGRLAEVLAAAAPSRRPGELAAAAGLASVHTGVRMTDVLARCGPPGEGIRRFVDRWMDGVPTAAPAGGPLEFALVDRAMGEGLQPGDGPVDALLTTGGTGDLGGLLRTVLGEHRYGVPIEGPVAAYHRLHKCYAAGDLTGVLSAARELELPGAERTMLQRLSRIWAAEALTLLGRDDEGAAWLSLVPDEPPYTALRWWAQTSAAAVPEQLEAARRAYDRQLAHGSRIGVELLLVRATDLAARSGLNVQAQAFAVLADKAGPRHVSTETRLLVRALAREDLPAATAALDLIRARGHRPALVRAALAVARMADDPRPWLQEAQETAERSASPRLRSDVAAVMRDLSVPVRAQRPLRSAYSDIELQIIELIRRAHTNRQIAARIQMSEKTVENYLTRLFARTGCRSRVELAAISLPAGMAA
uniref:helix-turn-helix transcriptional regulator n=1 Tax=Paractinoplanes polyasparticus TaxID=2856853 RepID=UPI0027DF42D8|nr:LuxR family transcriptional regulator [Actinoplanes polyasparticus]